MAAPNLEFQTPAATYSMLPDRPCKRKAPRFSTAHEHPKSKRCLDMTDALSQGDAAELTDVFVDDQVHRDIQKMLSVNASTPDTVLFPDLPDSDHSYCAQVLIILSKHFNASPRNFVLACTLYRRFVERALPTRRVPLPHLMACFILALKEHEPWCASLWDMTTVFYDVVVHTKDILSAEHEILETLHWNIGLVTAIDVVHKLFERAIIHPDVNLSDVELVIETACCARKQSAADVMAVGAILTVLSVELDMSVDKVKHPSFVPSAMVSKDARDWASTMILFLSKLDPNVACSNKFLRKLMKN